MMVLSYKTMIINGKELLHGMINTPWYVYLITIVVTVLAVLIFDRVSCFLESRKKKANELEEYMHRNWSISGGCLIDMDMETGKMRSFFGNVLKVFSHLKIDSFTSLSEDDKMTVGKKYIEMCYNKYKFNMTLMVDNIIVDCEECCNALTK